MKYLGPYDELHIGDKVYKPGDTVKVTKEQLAQVGLDVVFDTSEDTVSVEQPTFTPSAEKQ